MKYSSNLKIYNSKVTWGACHLLSARCVRLFQIKDLLEIFPCLSNNCQKTGKMRSETWHCKCVYYSSKNKSLQTRYLLIYWKKQPPEKLCKKDCSKKCCNIHVKKPVLDSPFNKKETPTQVLSCECYEIFKNTYLEEQTAASVLKNALNYYWRSELL